MSDRLFDLRAKRELHSGFGDALGRGLELALTPVLFGGLGWLLDRWLDTGPAFTIALVVFACAGIFVRMWIGYDTAMRRQEDQVPALRRRIAPGPADTTSGPGTER